MKNDGCQYWLEGHFAPNRGMKLHRNASKQLTDDFTFLLVPLMYKVYKYKTTDKLVTDHSFCLES